MKNTRQNSASIKKKVTNVLVHLFLTGRTYVKRRRRPCSGTGKWRCIYALWRDNRAFHCNCK